jgi:hypothetical protein
MIMPINYTLYIRTYFVGLIFAESCLPAKTVKIGPHENSCYTVVLLQACSIAPIIRTASNEVDSCF